ncbi:MAG: exosome complex exonuclease Rrp41 [Candidatus Aenigmarchaeota archaeon]|nr:exosome complex exonuclease Rrp41 [Candidatus Aenigmarchaeota archaeon]
MIRMIRGKRKNDELRDFEIKAGVVPNANGSAMVRMGKTTAIAAVYGPRNLYPRFMQVTDRAIIRCNYNMVPFSTKERVRPGPSRRSKEISLVTKNSLESVLCLEEFPKAVVDVFIDIIQADAGTRCAGINAAAVALADAGIPMKDLVASVAAGKIGNKYMLDLEGEEEDESACDLPIAYLPRTKGITLLQMDGDLTPKDVKEITKLAIKGCEKIYEAQKKALEKRWVGK